MNSRYRLCPVLLGLVCVIAAGAVAPADAQIGEPEFGKVNPETREADQEPGQATSGPASKLPRPPKSSGQQPQATASPGQPPAGEPAAQSAPPGASADSNSSSAPDEAPSSASEDAPRPGGVFCEVDVFYSWARPDEPKAANHSAKPRPEPSGVYFAKFSEAAPSKLEAKSLLSAKLPELHEQALQRCREEHQNQTVCVSSKMKTLQDDYLRSDFASRRALLQSITSDCLDKAGACIKGYSNDIRCKDGAPLQHTAEKSNKTEPPPTDTQQAAATPPAKEK